MSIDILKGNDTLTLNGRVLSCFADGEVVVVEYPNDGASLTTGKDGNSIYVNSPSGWNVNVTLRILLNSSDDRFLSLLQNQQEQDFSSFTLLFGNFTKKLGDGKGKTTKVAWELEGGIFIRRQDGRDNTNLETEQGVAVYNLRFSRAKRTIS